MRGDGPVSRGGKVRDQFSMVSQGKQLGYTSSSSSASPSPSDKELDSNKGVNVAMSLLK